MDPRDWSRIQQGIFAGESGGDYGALFGYQNRPNGRFSGVDLTKMTVDQALDFANPSGPYGQYVKGQVGRVATPMGAYQIVGTTLRAAKEGLGLRGDEVLTPAMQDKLGQWIYKTQGTGAWEGYKPMTEGQAIAAETMSLLGKGPQTSTKGPQMMQEQKPQGLLGSLGIQKMEEGAEGETGQRFYNRESFKDTAAVLAQGFGRMGIMGMEEIADDIAKQRTENKARNKTAEYLDKFAPGAGDLFRGGVLGAKDVIAVVKDQRSSALASQAAEALRNGDMTEAMALLTELSPTAMGQQIAARSAPRRSEVTGGGKYTIDYDESGNPNIRVNEDVIAAERRIKKAEKALAPLPTDARKAEEEDFSALQSYDNLIQDIGGIIDDFGYDPKTDEFKGPLDIGLGGFVRGSMGVVGLGKENEETAKARQEFDRFKTRLVNESLRLNKGVQTEGDAQRAARELGSAKTEATAYAAVQELLRINERARANKAASIQRRRDRFGVRGTTVPEAPVSPNLGWKVIEE